MRNMILAFILLSLVLPVNSVIAADLEFGSFTEAENAAQKRAQEYQQKMDEHMKDIQEEWEQQQKDLGADNANPDITKITSRSDGQRSNNTEAADSMQNAVNDSVNNLKNTMINTAGPNSTGFAGGGAGYQWSVKYVGGKYVLSDSYDEADFNTGKKKEKADTPAPVPAAQGKDDKTTTVAAKTPDKPASRTTTPAPAPKEPSPTEIARTPAAPPSSTSSSGSSSPGSSDSPSRTSSTATPGSDRSSGSSEPAAPTKSSSDSATPASPGIDPAPANLPPPKVRLVIQNPTDFSEEVFASNTDNKSSVSYGLEKFRIPEDTRVKIAVEVSDDLDPQDVSLVIVDEEGEREPVKASKMGNYRHMFRVPSEKSYSANVYVTDKDSPGNQKKKLMQVKIPVTKVDFDSRTIDNQRGTRTSDGSSSSGMSSSTSSSGSMGGYTHSSHGQAQQVDLSDLYSDPDADASSSSSESQSSSNLSGSSDASGSAGSSGSEAASAASTGGNTGSTDYVGNTSPGDAQDSSGNYGASSQRSGTTEGGNYSSQTDNRSSTGADTASRGQTADYGSEGTRSDSQSTDSTEGYSNSDYASDGTGESGQYEPGETNTGAQGDRNYEADTGSEAGRYDNTGTNTGKDDSGRYDSSYSARGEGRDNDEDDIYADSSNSSGDYQGKYASANGIDNNSANRNQSTANSAAESDATENQEPEEADSFIMSLALRSEAHKIYQSFDFSEEHSQTATTLPADSEIIFNIVLGSEVEFDSVKVKLVDGGEEIAGNLRTMGEAFAYSFKNASPDSYIQVSGRAGRQPFSYRVKTPVVKK